MGKDVMGDFYAWVLMFSFLIGILKIIRLNVSDVIIRDRLACSTGRNWSRRVQPSDIYCWIL